MPATRVSVPSFPALSDAELREWLRIDPSIDQFTLDMLLGSAVDFVEGQIGKVLIAADYEIDLGCPGRVVPIGICPVNSVSISGAYATEDSVVDDIFDDLDSALWEWDSQRGLIRFLEDEPPRRIAIRVNAGFTNVASIPDSLRHAIAILVGASYDGRVALDEKTFTTVNRLIARHRKMVL